MKTEKFEKVVEWEKEPCSAGIISGIIYLVCGIAILFISLHQKIFVFSIFLFCLIFGLFFIQLFDSIGKGKKVYWRKIK